MESYFAQINKQLDQIDKRLNQVGKRLEMRQYNMDKPFEQMQQYIDKKFNFMQWLIVIAVTLVSSLMSLLRFLPVIPS